MRRHNLLQPLQLSISFSQLSQIHRADKICRLELVTVECAFSDAPFRLSPARDVIQVRSEAILWQKERLLNIALAHMDDRFAKFAWIDADILFTNPNWAPACSRLLEDVPIAQLFEEIIQLPKDATIYDGIGLKFKSLAATISEDPSSLRNGYNQHGRTGYAWCARREIFKDGIFDACILGDSDHMIAHAAMGDWSSECIDLTFYTDLKQRANYEKWGRQFYAQVQGNVGYLPDTILHLWHGNTQNRRYRERAEKLARFGVDPDVDLRINSDLCWEWNTNRPSLHRYVAKYFELRNDDEEVQVKR